MKKSNDLVENREKIIELFEKFGLLLSKGQKLTLELYLIEDLSMNEIADELSISKSAVHDSIKKGVQKLFAIQEKLE
ncbi:sigma factor-like helix-turn-helix DNA-binding protein [Mycoplasmopsis pulmonis]|nr:sigma factor-like helix-turn-helix DNA-binding protein [Mycoplasmopsis pulmonis]MDZ7293693.1 hypothetical protein [Mycoplasmopsis pulmonis]VEU68440.1 putative UPF0122 protein MCAP_0480 [Mycoplasmopsis pulmonis]